MIESQELADASLSSEEMNYPEAERLVLRALRFLANQCDFATSKDGAGFNKFDGDFGRDLIRKAGTWTARQLLAAYKVARKYERTQLSPAGIALPEESAVQALARHKEEAYTARKQRYDSSPTQPQSTNQARIIGLNDGMLGVMFPNRSSDFQSNLSKIHAIQSEVEGVCAIDRTMKHVAFVEGVGKKSGEVIKYWQVPISYVERVIADFPKFHVLPAVTEIIQAERRRVEEEARKAWEAEQKRRERVEKLLAVLGDLSKPVGDRVLYEHQREAVRTMIEWGSGVLAFDVGTGKTLIGSIIGLAYKRAENCSVVIAGPLTIRGAWLEEAARIGVPIEYYAHDSIPDDFPGKYVLIVDECDMYQNTRAKRTQKFLKLAQNAVACYPMSGTPARNGRPAGIYSALLAVKNPHVYAELQDGTPAVDEIKKLRKRYEARYCAATATEHSAWDTTGAAFLTEFHSKFVGTPRGILRKLIDDCIDLPEKVRELVPVELNAQEVETFRAEVAKMWEEHEKRVAEQIEAFKAERLPALLEEEIKGWLRRALDKKRIDNLEEMLKLVPANEVEDFKSKTAAVLLEEEEDRLKQADALVAMGQYRHAGSRAKARTTIEMVRQIFEEDARAAEDAERENRSHTPAAVVVFCEFKDVAGMIADAFDVPVLSGDTPDKKRKPMIDAFQNGERRVFVSIYGAGGVGITLHAAAYIILVGRPWTPGAATQAEARIRRIGQTRTCLCQWLQIPAHINPVDSKVDQILQRKQKNISVMLDGAKEGNEVNALEFSREEALDLFYEATHFKAGKESEASNE
jgi:superfamily II DNA or RNA helicase